MLLWTTARGNVLRHFKNESKGWGQRVQDRTRSAVNMSIMYSVYRQTGNTKSNNLWQVQVKNFKGNTVVMP